MSLNVLVVDDCDVIRTMIAKTLRLARLPLGEVREAANGAEALDLLGSSWIDLVLADINMPVMDGAEMLERMRSRPETADVPVIVVSTEGARERVDELMAKGVSAWVRKPFTPEEIRDAILEVTAGWPRGCRTDIVDDSFRLVSEQFALVFADPAPEGDPSVTEPPEGELLFAHASFSGASAGALGIAAPWSLVAEMAANVLGLEPDDEVAAAKGPATLAELVNMTCGRLVTNLDAEAATILHPPSVAAIDGAEWRRLAAEQSTRAYLVEDVPVLVTVGLRPARTR